MAESLPLPTKWGLNMARLFPSLIMVPVASDHRDLTHSIAACQLLPLLFYVHGESWWTGMIDQSFILPDWYFSVALHFWSIFLLYERYGWGWALILPHIFGLGVTSASAFVRIILPNTPRRLRVGIYQFCTESYAESTNVLDITGMRAPTSQKRPKNISQCFDRSLRHSLSFSRWIFWFRFTAKKAAALTTL